jgi:hypothetical protein
MRKILVIVGIVLVLFGIYILRPVSFEQRREGVVNDLNEAIALAKESGEYRCCIEPACKMCYLGNWMFEDGKCACDDKIAEGKLDQVCPECVHGMEEGRCESSEDSCSVEI